jgi:phosphoribosyl 1,2-cyclic phosphodiesterase
MRKNVARRRRAFESVRMAMRLRILGSGSSGNSALIVTAGARVLVDAGFSARRLGRLLAETGESLAQIDAVFITHEHGDHIAGVEGLKKFPQIQLFAHRATARAVQEGLTYRPAWKTFETGARFRFRDLEVESFAVPHDAHDPVGFRFTSGLEADLFDPRRSLAWVTDLGHAPPHVREQLRECDVVVVESNHCPRMLQADARRSWSTKQRISGRHGHLSNDAALELLSSVASPRWRRIYLTHLSRDCNSPAAVAAAFAPIRALVGCELAIVGHGEGTPSYEFL